MCGGPRDPGAPSALRDSRPESPRHTNMGATFTSRHDPAKSPARLTGAHESESASRLGLQNMQDHESHGAPLRWPDDGLSDEEHSFSETCALPT